MSGDLRKWIQPYRPRRRPIVPAVWDGLCEARRHGLDHRGQKCDLCPWIRRVEVEGRGVRLAMVLRGRERGWAQVIRPIGGGELRAEVGWLSPGDVDLDFAADCAAGIQMLVDAARAARAEMEER